MPEEINRISADHCPDFLFAPTQTARKNRENEGLAKKAFFTGDIMLDSLLLNKEKAQQKSTILNSLNLNPKEYLLLTLHRPYNVDQAETLMAIFGVLSRSPHTIVFPAHPRARKIMAQFGIHPGSNIRMIDPAPTEAMLRLPGFHPTGIPCPENHHRFRGNTIPTKTPRSLGANRPRRSGCCRIARC